MNEITSKILNDTYFVYGVENSGIKTISFEPCGVNLDFPWLIL